MNFTKNNFLIISLIIGLLILPMIAFSAVDNQTTSKIIQKEMNDQTKIDFIDELDTRLHEDDTIEPLAKLNVTTKLSAECLSSPLCKNIKERDITEQVSIYYPNTYTEDFVPGLRGSSSPLTLVFAGEDYFRYTPLRVEVSAYLYPGDGGNNITIEYSDSCKIFLYPNQNANCTITVKPR